MLRLDWNILITVINLVILYFLMRYFLFKPVNKIMQERQKMIELQRADAQKSRDDADALKKQYEDSVASIDAMERQKMAEATKKATQEYEKIVEQANAKADEIVADAALEAKAEKEKAIKEAGDKIAGIIVDAASKIASSQSDDTFNQELLDEFIEKAGD